MSSRPRREGALDPLLNGVQGLPLLDLRLGTGRRRREDIPRLRLEGHLAALPGALAELHGRLEQGELVHPRREPARSAEVVETAEHAHQGVVRRLDGDVVELVPAEMGLRRSAAPDLEARSPHEQRVEPRHRLVPLAPVGPKRAQPLT